MNYKGYVLKEEFIKFYGLEKAKELFEAVRDSLKDESQLKWDSTSYGIQSDSVWYVSEDGDLDGWLVPALQYGDYYKVSPEQFVKDLLWEDYNMKIKENKTKKPKTRYRKKRQPVPKRKKTDITVYYGTGEKYTIKNISGLHVEDGFISVVTLPQEKDGFIEDKGYHFHTSSVDSLLVKSPEETFTLDHVGDNYFNLSKDNLEMTLTTVKQVF